MVILDHIQDSHRNATLRLDLWEDMALTTGVETQGAFWMCKKLNFDHNVAGKERQLQLHELNEW